MTVLGKALGPVANMKSSFDQQVASQSIQMLESLPAEKSVCSTIL
ncbi:hypothetical protein SEQ_0577 [Streptococcus equi subsp. equi 4047]|uniref:Uncharacterized protein n=1 Tax=Streptococcus equi subsp. equi (strain 4047) TaxID=553482 RepID=C0MAW1_STRE4|nr:hypothetical protein SEQ_0577 [Streptococcus equi subsp. equi 4047]